MTRDEARRTPLTLWHLIEFGRWMVFWFAPRNEPSPSAWKHAAKADLSHSLEVEG
jgi:hypothetical protein